MSLREIVMDVPPQDVITRDNVSVKVNAVVYFRVLHPEEALIKVENFHYGTSQLAQTTLRSICGQGELDRILSEREAINRQLQEELDRGTDPWGVKVRAVEIKHIDLPKDGKIWMFVTKAPPKRTSDATQFRVSSTTAGQELDAQEASGPPIQLESTPAPEFPLDVRAGAGAGGEVRNTTISDVEKQDA